MNHIPRLSYLLSAFLFSIHASGQDPIDPQPAEILPSFAAEAFKIKEKRLGEVPFMWDRRNDCLQINAARKQFRGKWARAGVTPKLPEGVYDIRITGVLEEDGETPYRLFVNETLIGEVVNHFVESEDNFKRSHHVFEKVEIPADASVFVESMAVTNGLIPENDETAWARGRWTKIEIGPIGSFKAE